MSAKSKKSSGAIDRPFAPDVLSRAEAIAEQYQVILSREAGHWYGRGLELPNVFGDGVSAEKCVNATRDAMVGAVAFLIEQGQQPPMPAQADARNEQVNVPLTSEEKLRLEGAAKRKGFTGLSDFMRTAAVEFSK